MLSPQQDICRSFQGSAGIMDEVAKTTHELEDGKGYEMLPPGEAMAPASRNSQHLCLSALDGAVNIPPEWGMRLWRPQPSLINCLLGKRSHFFPAVLPLISCPRFSSLPPCSGKLLQLNSVSPKKKEKGIKVEEKLAGGKDRVTGSGNAQ